MFFFRTMIFLLSSVLPPASFLLLMRECRLRMGCHARPAEDLGILLHLLPYLICIPAYGHLHMTSWQISPDIYLFSIRCVLSLEAFPVGRELSFCSHYIFVGRVTFYQCLYN